MTDSEMCSLCGKRGKRPCPATGRWICPTCCGTHRGSQLNCPSECSFFPFGTAGFQHWNAVNQSWASKSMRRLDSCLGDKTMAGIFQRFLPSGKARRQEDVYMVYFPVIYDGLLVHRDAEGQTCVKRWEADGWVGLNNDEKVMMGFRRNSFVTVIESQRTSDGQFVECVDLLEPDPKPFRILAPSATSSMPRFTRLLTWLTPYPDFHRLGGLSFQIPDLLWPIWEQALAERVTEAQKTRPDLSTKEFLAEKICECGAWLEKLRTEARNRVAESLAQQLSEREKLGLAVVGPSLPNPAPARPTSSPSQITPQAHKERYDTQLDQSVPLLDGLTPRTAAKNPTLRPKLIAWLKGQIHYLEVVNQRDGLNLNIDWVLDELGVPELK